MLALAAGFIYNLTVIYREAIFEIRVITRGLQMKTEKDKAQAMFVLLVTVTVFSTICCVEGPLNDEFSALSWAASSLMVVVWILGCFYFASHSDRKKRIWQIVIVSAAAVLLAAFAYCMQVGYIKGSFLMLTPLVPIMGFADMLGYLLQVFEPDEKVIFAMIAIMLIVVNTGICTAAALRQKK